MQLMTFAMSHDKFYLLGSEMENETLSILNFEARQPFTGKII